MNIESVISDLRELIKGNGEIVRITAAAGKRAMLDSKTPSVIQTEETSEKGKFQLNLLSPKGTTDLGIVTSDIALTEDDLLKIRKMNEKGLKGYESQINK